MTTRRSRTLRLMPTLLDRTMRHAMARDKIKRNVVMLCDVPTGLRVDLDGPTGLHSSVPPMIAVHRSVRASPGRALRSGPPDLVHHEISVDGESATRDARGHPWTSATSHRSWRRSASMSRVKT